MKMSADFLIIIICILNLSIGILGAGESGKAIYTYSRNPISSFFNKGSKSKYSNSFKRPQSYASDATQVFINTPDDLTLQNETSAAIQSSISFTNSLYHDSNGPVSQESYTPVPQSKPTPSSNINNYNNYNNDVQSSSANYMLPFEPTAEPSNGAYSVLPADSMAPPMGPPAPPPRPSPYGNGNVGYGNGNGKPVPYEPYTPLTATNGNHGNPGYYQVSSGSPYTQQPQQHQPQQHQPQQLQSQQHQPQQHQPQQQSQNIHYQDYRPTQQVPSRPSNPSSSSSNSNNPGYFATSPNHVQPQNQVTSSGTHYNPPGSNNPYQEGPLPTTQQHYTPPGANTNPYQDGVLTSQHSNPYIGNGVQSRPPYYDPPSPTPTSTTPASTTTNDDGDQSLQVSNSNQPSESSTSLDNMLLGTPSGGSQTTTNPGSSLDDFTDYFTATNGNPSQSQATQPGLSDGNPLSEADLDNMNLMSPQMSEYLFDPDDTEFGAEGTSDAEYEEVSNIDDPPSLLDAIPNFGMANPFGQQGQQGQQAPATPPTGPTPTPDNPLNFLNLVGTDFQPGRMVNIFFGLFIMLFMIILHGYALWILGIAYLPGTRSLNQWEINVDTVHNLCEAVLDALEYWENKVD